MSYANYPSAGNPPPQQQPPNNDNRKLIYGILIAALLGTWGYIIYDKSKSNETITQLQTQYSNVDSARNTVQQEYNEALARMDSLTGSNTQLQGQLEERKTEIDRLKNQIRTELGKKNADLTKARSMIAELNGKINDLLTQMDELKAQNKQLTVVNQTLTTERDTLTAQKLAIQDTLVTTLEEKARVEDIGSTLHVSNINVTGIDFRGGKEKATSKAKRVDVFRISFDLDENRISSSGDKELYISVFSPDGNPITLPSNGSGTFETREEGEKVFTTKVSVNYEQGKRVPVSFDWKPEAGKYQTGQYKIEIYHNGYKIGEGTKNLKKAGLFG